MPNQSHGQGAVATRRGASALASVSSESLGANVGTVLGPWPLLETVAEVTLAVSAVGALGATLAPTQAG